MDEVIKKLLAFLEKNWYRKSTFFVLIIIFPLLLWFFSIVKLEEISAAATVLSFSVFTVAVLFWLYSIQLPKAPKGKIGFAVGIITDDPLQQRKIKRDFIQTLRDLLNQSHFRYSFAFVEIPSHFIEDMFSPEVATKTFKKTRCSFMIYGKARTVMLNGTMQHVLNLEGLVAHEPISNEISKSFSKEFADLLPRRMTISDEGELFQFELTANWIDLISKYIIGVASLLSGDVGYSQELFENLQLTLPKVNPNFPALVKIQQRLPSRLEYIYIVQLNGYYNKWLQTRDSDLISKMKPYLDKLKVVSPNSFDARFFRTLWYFVVNRDVGKAKTEILKASKRKHTTWQYNYAFLLAYEGNIQEAEKQYKFALDEIFEEPKVVLDVVEFIMWVLDSEPDKTQLHYCLGLVHYYAIKDYSLALQDFERFVEVTPVERFSSQRKEAQRLIIKIRKDIKSGKVEFENEIAT